MAQQKKLPPESGGSFESELADDDAYFAITIFFMSVNVGVSMR